MCQVEKHFKRLKAVELTRLGRVLDDELSERRKPVQQVEHQCDHVDGEEHKTPERTVKRL